MKVVLGVFEIEGEWKGIVVGRRRKEVEELGWCWRKYFRVVWIEGKVGGGEKVCGRKEFVSEGRMGVVMGRKLVSEGIEIKELMMVMMVDNRVNIIEVIEGVGRVRDGGVCYVLCRKKSWGGRNGKGELGGIKEGCIREEVGELYGVE
ncbi:hypothetical protein ACRFB9_28255 [Klebsiella pneumoniae]